MSAIMGVERVCIDLLNLKPHRANLPVSISLYVGSAVTAAYIPHLVYTYHAAQTL